MNKGTKCIVCIFTAVVPCFETVVLQKKKEVTENRLYCTVALAIRFP